MTLYHFCAEKHVKNILRHGLTIGGVSEFTKDGFILHNGWIWLTLDDDPANQSWATRNMVKYDRTAWRLTIGLTDDLMCKLYDRDKLIALYPATSGLFDGWKGSENWRVFHGSIPPQMILRATRSDMIGGRFNDCESVYQMRAVDCCCPSWQSHE